MVMSYELHKRKFLEKFNSESHAKARNNKHVIIIGDSHAGVFNYIQKKHLLKGYSFDVNTIPSSSTQGLLNIHSKSQARRKIKRRISTAKSFQILLFLFGEVDCGCAIWRYARIRSNPVGKQFRRSIRNYSTFLSEMQKKGFRKICVLSVPLPILRDGQIKKGREDITVSQRKRTLLTIKFNQFVKDFCKRNDIMFIDTSSELINQKTGLIKEYFMWEKRINHHIQQSKYSEVICKAMRAIDI